MALLIGAGTLLFRTFRSPEHFQQALIAELEEQTGARFSFQKAQLALFPSPVFRALQPRLTTMNERVPELSAEEARFSFRLLPLLWGQVRLSGFQIRKASGTLGGIPFEQVDLKVRGFGPKRPVPFELRMREGKAKEVLKGKGKFFWEGAGENFWKGFGLQCDIGLKSFPLVRTMNFPFWRHFPAGFQSGEWNGTLHLSKEKGKDALEAQGQFKIRELRFQTEFSWNFQNSLLEFKQASVQTPFGEMDLTGVFNGDTREIKEARLIGRNLVLDEGIRIFPNLNALLPLGTGFSGTSDLDLTLRGTPDFLSLHANWNLASAVLTYGKVFSKPKEDPMSIHFDVLLKGGNLLSGDLSVRIGETTIKGALGSLDLKTGTGEISFLTNKFALNGWTSLLTPFSRYRIGGSAKVLLNLKGNLTQPQKAEQMLNLTLDQASLMAPNGRGIQEVSGHFDASPLSLRVQKALFKVGGSTIQLEAEIYNLLDNPQGKLGLVAPRLEPSAFLEHLKELEFLSPWYQKMAGGFHLEGIQAFFPPSVPLEDLNLALELGPHKLALKNLEFRALGGGVKLRGQKDESSEKTLFELEVQLEQISLSRYFEAMGQTDPVLEGNLFAVGQFQAQGWKSGEIQKLLTGKGTLSITNGEWHSLDLLGPLQDFKAFQGLKGYRNSSTHFHDLKATWTYKENRFGSEDFLIHSEDFWIDGKGNLLLDGTLNARLDVYLSKFLTEEAFKSWHSAGETEGKQLGPIPLLLVGKMTAPELRIDDRSFEPLVEAIRNRRYRRVLHEPFKE